MRYNLIFLIGALISGLWISGCAMSKATIDSFTDPSFAPGTIRSIAVFPARNMRLAPSESQKINRSITTAINKRNPSIKILGAGEAIKILNENDLADDFAVFLDNYIVSGVPDGKFLGQIGQLLGVDAIMQGELVNVVQQDGAYGQNKGQTRVTVRFTILGTKEGKLLWEASSDGIKGTATTLGEAPPIGEAVGLAVEKIMANLPI